MAKDLENKSILQLLRIIRTDGTKDDEASKVLFSRLSGKEAGTHQQCQNFYESALKYYIDDEYDLELLLAVSGCSEGYKSIRTAVGRRDKYLAYLTETDSSSKYKNMDSETVRKHEDKCLKYVAEKLQRDKDDGALEKLIAQWLDVPKENLSSLEITENMEYPPIEEIFLAQRILFFPLVRFFS